MKVQNQSKNILSTHPQKSQPQPHTELATTEQHRYQKNPINIIFKNISYSVQVDKKVEHLQLPCKKQKQTKVILKNVTGIFKAGEVSAILGASGAGKTSLLNIIACRIAHTDGKLYANQKEYDYNSFGDFANYVMQNDILMQTLTVRETLNFAADLKLNVSAKEKRRKIVELANSMKLQKCLDTQVGGQVIKGISGGQKKRTSIAFELISDPQVIMLDQPTSGLDSLTSFIIVDYLRKLAHNGGRTVIMTIHQPNTDIYRKFDRLFLMVEGRFVYQGAANQAISYFGSNFNLSCGQFTNPAEFQIQVIHQQNQQNVKRYPEYFRTYDQKQNPKVLTQIQAIKNTQIIVRQNVDISVGSMFCSLVKRDFINTTRNPMLFKSRFIQSIILGLYIGGVYFDAGRRDYVTQTNWVAIIGFFFFIGIGSLMSALAPISLVFPTERAVFLKEQNSRMYTVLPYFLSRNVIEIPYLIIMPFIFDLVFYWMMGLANTAQQFFVFYLITFLINLCGNSLGLLLGSLFSDAKSVSAVVPLILLPFVLFSGLFKNTGNLSSWFGWIQYISPLKYGYIAMIDNQVKYKVSNIASMNFDVSLWTSIGLLIALSLGYRVLSLFFLWLARTKIQ